MSTTMKPLMKRAILPNMEEGMSKLKKAGEGVNSELVRDRAGERGQVFRQNLTDYQKTSKPMIDIALGKVRTSKQ